MPLQDGLGIKVHLSDGQQSKPFKIATIYAQSMSMPLQDGLGMKIYLSDGQQSKPFKIDRI